MFTVHTGDTKSAPKGFHDQRLAIDHACKLVTELAPFAAVAVVSNKTVIGVAVDDANGVRFRYLTGLDPAVPAFQHGETGGSEVGLQDICHDISQRDGWKR